MKQHEQGRLIIDADSTFQLYSWETNPPPDTMELVYRYFFTTKGTWKVDHKNLLLTSDSSIVYPSLVEFLDTNKLLQTGFEVTFLDYKNDTIPIFEFQLNNLTSISRLRGILKTAELHPETLDNDNMIRQLGELKEVKFTFFDYPPLIMPYSELNGNKYTIRLLPKGIPNYFQNHPLKIQNNRLIDAQCNFEFIQKR